MTGARMGFEVTLKVDPDRANIAGVTNQDVAQSSSAALSGASVTTLRRGDQQIPVVSRCAWKSAPRSPTFRICTFILRHRNNKVPLLEVSKIENDAADAAHPPPGAFPDDLRAEFHDPGVLPSEVFRAAAPQAGGTAENSCRRATTSSISGEQAKQEQGFKNLAVVMADFDRA